MKDPKVTEMVNELNRLVTDLNKLNKKLYKQGVTYTLNDGYDRDTESKMLTVQYLKQTVEY